MAPTHHRKRSTTIASKKAAPISSSKLTIHISISGALLWLLTACATMISHEDPPRDWPSLKITIHYVGFFEVQRRCYKYLSIWAKLSGSLPMQCAEINFAENTCNIWRPSNDTDGDEHEIEHCRGKDHPGDRTLRDAWANYKATKSFAASSKR